MFERLIWQDDRVLLDDLVFRLQHYANDAWELGDECFIFYKIKKLIDQYEHFFESRTPFHPRRILELGLWDGGSVAFWFEHFHPDEKHVGVDISKRGDSEYFRRYLQARGLTDRIRNYWGVDQSDQQTLSQIVADEFGGTIDLVIDDASHMYDLTKRSFEILYPFVRPGGLYIIEDWAWEHWREFQSFKPWALETAPTKLISELVEATGTSTALIQSLTVYEGFTVIERGTIDRATLGDFKLEAYILRRPRVSQSRRAWRRFVTRVRSRLTPGIHDKQG